MLVFVLAFRSDDLPADGLDPRRLDAHRLAGVRRKLSTQLQHRATNQVSGLSRSLVAVIVAFCPLQNAVIVEL